MGLRKLSLLAAAIAASCLPRPRGGRGPGARPPVVWLKGEGNFTKSHRPVASIDKIVVHVTEGAFWGSVRWLKSPRAHASSHYVVSRRGKIVQLVHLSDIAWHAGNWNVNTQSVGIEHEGFTYGPGGFTNAQYHASARLAGWIARRSLMPIDRRHFIGHAEVPGTRWRAGRLLAPHRSGPALEVGLLPPARPPLRGRPEAERAARRARRARCAASSPGARRRPATSARSSSRSTAGSSRPTARRPSRSPGGLNTTKLGNGTHVLQVYGVAGPGRYDIARKTIVVDNKSFALTSAGARPWTKVRGPVKLRVRPWGAKAASMTFLVDGHRRAVDRRPPFLFAWNAARAKPGKHVLAGRRHLGRRPHREAADPARRREARRRRSRSRP